MKILYVTTIGSTMEFFENFIKELLSEGHTVDIATNDMERKTPDCYKNLGCRVYTLSCSRSPLDKGNLESIGQIRRLVEKERYDIVHCHTPIAAACTRIACRKLRKKQGVKVFYTAHGFHFYKGAPLLNWLVYYPVEKLCAYFTDKLITINREDYNRAKRRFHAGEVLYVPGVGVDLSKFENVQVDRAAKRREIGVPEGATLLISVGELSRRKNHSVVIKSLAQLSDTNIHYVIAGRGELEQELRELAAASGIADRVHLLGFRRDIAELYKASDLCSFPSFQEGLPVAVMEAMACGLPVACSDIRGNVDLIKEEGGVLFDPHSAGSCAEAIKRVLGGDMRSMGGANRKQAMNYSDGTINVAMKSIYEKE